MGTTSVTTQVAATSRPSRLAGAKLLAAIQLSVVAVYAAATLAPYVFYFVVPGRPLFSSTRPNIAPSNIIGGDGGWLNPLNWLVILGFLVTEFGVALTGLLSLAGAVMVAATWRHCRPVMRTSAITATILCVALLAFQLTPLGASLANWVSD
ncbi:hypothetical protein ACNTMW_34005 [Planosporangium sp. 12N6]|jgi:hypothetical protein|uniref:hypothetical protein n=1 Tax=Planosporangium spinosum TaxID=3402278 RepID=UPI003CEA4162